MIIVESNTMGEHTTDFQPWNVCATFPSPLGWADILPTLRASKLMPQQRRFLQLRERLEFQFGQKLFIEAKERVPRFRLVGLAPLTWLSTDERPEGSEICQPMSEAIFASTSLTDLMGFASMNWIGMTGRPEGSAGCQPRSEDIFASYSIAKMAVGLGRNRFFQKSEERSDPRRAKSISLFVGGNY